MIKQIFCVGVVGVLLHPVAYAADRLYDRRVCTTGTCATEATIWGNACTCDDIYMMPMWPQQCETERDCMNNTYQGDEEYPYYDMSESIEAECYHGYCAREIRTGGECEEDYQFNGSYYIADAKLMEDSCYICPRNATCTNYHVMCNSGYYLFSLGNGVSAECRRCPQWNGGYARSDGNRTSINDCYFSTDQTFSDTTGTFVVTGDCRYE